MPAYLVGVLVMLGSPSPRLMPLMNTSAVLTGMLVVALAGAGLGRQVQASAGRLAVVSSGLLALPFAFEPLSGVHRWINLGPVGLHPSSIFAPLALLCLVQLLRSHRVVAAILVLAALELVHVAQPDAGQATAVAAGAIVAVLHARLPPRLWLLGVAVAVAGTIAAWSRPDPLEPVAFVEDMPARAFELGVPFGVAGIVGLAALPAAALARLRARPSPDGVDASLVLFAYFAATVAVTFFGHFPTPVLGYGASPILGAVLGLGLLHGASPAHEDEGRASPSG